MKDFKTRINEIQKQQELLKNKEKELKAKAIEQERKTRTRRLIQTGGVVEKVLGPLSKEELELFASFLINEEKSGNYISKALKRPLQEEVFEL